MKKIGLTFLILLVTVVNGIAQQFPITVVPQVNAPAPVYLSNYADASTINSPLRVQLILNDISVTNEQIRLKIYLEGNGIAFESRDFVVGAAPLFINGGIPLTLDNTVLAPYFELQNLQGINANSYGAVLREGSYQFCFEVFDFSNGNRLSSRTCASTYVFRNEPPLLNMPLNRTNIVPSDVENIVFQWTPRQINVSNAVYELRIVEIWDDNVDPQTAFLTSIPVFETTTRATSFVYGPAQPLLLEGKRYAWGIRAKALQGAEEIGLFRNQGRSEIFWFSRTAPCATPTNVFAEAKGKNKINIFWDENRSLYSKYNIAYKEANDPEAEWFTMQTNSSWATIWHLKPGTTYDYKVSGVCKYQRGSFSTVKQVTTAVEEDKTADYNCGIVPDEIAVNNQNPHPGLKIGDRITAGDFVVVLTKLDSQNNGLISGTGFVKIPYLKYARLAVAFTNVLVNTDNQLARGEIVTVYDERFGTGETLTVDATIRPVEIITGDTGNIATATVNYDIATITQNEDGAWEITGTNGEQGLVPGGEDVVITDGDGTTYSVSESGTVTQGESAPGGPIATTNGTEGSTTLARTGISITLDDSGKYSFDQLASTEHTALTAQYPMVKQGDAEYPVVFKAVSQLNGDDNIIAKVNFNETAYTKDNLTFKTTEGVSIPITWNASGDEATLTLKQTFDYAIQDIIATVTDAETPNDAKVVYTFKLVHLGAQLSNINLVIVPINNARIPSGFERDINAIYNKAGVHFNTRIAPRLEVPQTLWDENQNNVLDVGDSSILSFYTPEEKVILNQLKSLPNYNDQVYYLLVSDLPLSTTTTSGFMPLKQQFGFVFSATNKAKIAAHELGHGVFGLEHPFSAYQTPEGSTNFLMDYGSGTTLSHMDWKKMHAPGFELYLFQNDEDGAWGNTQNEQQELSELLTYIKGQYNGEHKAIAWKELLFKHKKRRRGGANGINVYHNLLKEHTVNYQKAKLSFEIEKKPSDTISAVTVIPHKEVLEIIDNVGVLVFDNVYYRLTLKTDREDFVFKFDHHDDLEAFCNALQINRTVPYLTYNQSEFSKTIVKHLDKNYLPTNTLNPTNGNLSLYLKEAPKAHIDRSVITENSIIKSKINRLLNHINKRHTGINDTIDWENFLNKINKQGQTLKFISVRGKHVINYKGKPLQFTIVDYTERRAINKLEVTPNKALVKINTNVLLTNIKYTLTLKTNSEDLEFEFDHHDELEAFCNALLINRDKVHPVSNESDFSKQIITYLNDKYLPRQISTAIRTNLDLYLQELPKDHIAKLSDEDLWHAIRALLYDEVDDKGVSEEAIVIELIKILGERNADTLLNGLLNKKAFSGDHMFKALYKKIDNFGGDDNFTKWINELYKIWVQSNFSKTKQADSIPYVSKKTLGFYSSNGNLALSDDYTKVSVYSEVKDIIRAQRHQGSGGTINRVVVKEVHHGDYSIFDPITLVDYEKMGSAHTGLEAPNVNIPMFNLVAIVQNEKTNNAFLAGNLALETALTVTGVGNITKLRYLLKLRDLKKLTFTETVYLADGVATSLGVVNYMLEFSGTCGDDSPECKKIKEYLALVESSMSLGVANATLMKRKADEVLKALETNKGRLTISAEKRQKIIKHLREVANKQTVSLVENFRALERSGALKEVTLTIGDISLVLSNTSYLLKHAVCAENSTPVNQDDTLCKDIQEYLGYVQKAIKVKALVDKGVQVVAEKVYNRMNRHPNLFNTQQQRKAVLNELKKVVEAKPYHTNYSAQLKEDIATHPRIKQLFDNATNADRASLKAVWTALENRPHIRLGGPNTIKGENLEILEKVSPRFIYKGNSGVEGLKSFLAEGSKVERTQRYINNLQEANLLFDTSMPVTFSGVKKGDVIINDAAGKEIARYKGDVLQKKNIIEHPEQLGYTIVKQLEDFDMVRKGDEIGFKLK